MRLLAAARKHRKILAAMKIVGSHGPNPSLECLTCVAGWAFVDGIGAPR